jgi:hypothetical protein
MRFIACFARSACTRAAVTVEVHLANGLPSHQCAALDQRQAHRPSSLFGCMGARGACKRHHTGASAHIALHVVNTAGSNSVSGPFAHENLTNRPKRGEQIQRGDVQPRMGNFPMLKPCLWLLDWLVVGGPAGDKRFTTAPAVRQGREARRRFGCQCASARGPWRSSTPLARIEVDKPMARTDHVEAKP